MRAVADRDEIGDAQRTRKNFGTGMGAMNENLEMCSEWSPELTVMDWAIIKQALVAKAADGNLKAITLIFRMAKLPAYQAACETANAWRHEQQAPAPPPTADAPAIGVAETAAIRDDGDSIGGSPAAEIREFAATAGGANRHAARPAHATTARASGANAAAHPAGLVGCANSP